MSRLRTVVAGVFAGCLLLAGCGVDGTAEKTAGDSAQSSGQQSAAQQSSAPAPRPVSDGTFRVGTSDDPRVVVTVVEDMACPACAQFDSQYGSALGQIAALPGAAVDYRIIAFLDRMSSDRYSSRAANASYCVWNRAGDDAGRQDVWVKFQTAAFRDQPSEGGDGLSDDKLVALAESAGADDVEQCITSGKYLRDVSENSSSTTSEEWFHGTPTVRVNGSTVELRSPAALLSEVKDHLAK